MPKATKGRARNPGNRVADRRSSTEVPGQSNIRKRTDKWREPLRLLTGVVGDDDSAAKNIAKLSEELKAEDTPEEGTYTLIQSCRELIYDVDGDKPVFHMIAYAINTNLEICALHLMDMLVGEGKAGEDKNAVEREIVSTLAMASAAEVPVYCNTPNLEPELARYHRKMLLEGFQIPDAEGKLSRFKLTASPGTLVDSADYLREATGTRGYAPAELLLMREAVSAELTRLSTADRLLSSLSYAIDELRARLDTESRNEYSLQEWITENPILFGAEYSQIIPKHRLGSEYEMDYALVRHSGLIDLVELESSNLELYTKNEHPRSELVHAEQQVLDWHEWLEENGPYARQRLPNAYSPRGFVILGRDSMLTNRTRTKLRRRNLAFGESIQIMTYDDLLARAMGLLDVLQEA
ncbi:Shedu anti-phage system protein SduA domain-containing protein [Alienimonas chondri]|uniref:Shedu protein SduA C-terminal domain-containing protein n=1 Tax=Alienimonas chondri TaxID=2681879 RepID=A0ABX1VDQ1_9PLAN|nr:Shedu anti-phage system protein SduA domain-containing protein [Alienimonas chondri]NNJ25938.1 hypothetical protein [Alienimonas chondri]